MLSNFLCVDWLFVCYFVGCLDFMFIFKGVVFIVELLVFFVGYVGWVFFFILVFEIFFYFRLFCSF